MKVFPFVQNLSDKTKNSLKKYNIETVYNLPRKLNLIIRTGMDKQVQPNRLDVLIYDMWINVCFCSVKEDTTLIVYRIPFKNCERAFIYWTNQKAFKNQITSM